MAKIGFVLLVHDNSGRTVRLVKTLLAQDAIIALHVDRRAASADKRLIMAQLSGEPNLVILQSARLGWGEWSIVAKSIEGVRALLERNPELTHIYNISGSCMPLRPLDELRAFLAAPENQHDFIESVTITDQSWVVDGLEHERLELYHPFNWKEQRRLFELSVRIQSRLNIRRPLPPDLSPSFGSQWWCLRTETLRKLLADPLFDRYVNFFKKSWIPDESFFQSLVRKHSAGVNSQSLTFAKFDHFGSPFIFYNDHIDDLKSLDAFFARKIWPGADQLYDYFLGDDRKIQTVILGSREKLSAKLDAVIEYTTSSRKGLVSQFTKPVFSAGHYRARNRYYIFVGFEWFKGEILDHYKSSEKIIPYGSIFDPKAVELRLEKNGNVQIFNEDLAIRDYAPEQYLLQLIWFHPQSEIAFTTRAHWIKKLMRYVAADPNASLIFLEGGWLLDLANRKIENKARLRNIVRVEIKREIEFIAYLERKNTRAKITRIELGDWLSNDESARNNFPEGFQPKHAKADLKPILKLISRLNAEGILLSRYHLDKLDRKNKTTGSDEPRLSITNPDV